MKALSIVVLVIFNAIFGLSDISLRIWPNDTILEYNVGDTVNFTCQVENVSKVPQLYEIKDNYLRKLNVSFMEQKINYTKKIELSDNESMIYCLCIRNSNETVRFPPSVITDMLKIKVHMSKEDTISINKTRCKARDACPKINIKTKQISANESRVMCTSSNVILSDSFIHLHEIRDKELYITEARSIKGTANFTVKTNVIVKEMTIFCRARANNKTFTEFIISELVKIKTSNVSTNQQPTNENQTTNGPTNSREDNEQSNAENNEQSNAENNEQSKIGVIAGASIGSLLLILVIILFVCKIRSNGQTPDAYTPKVYYKTARSSRNGTPNAQIDGVSKSKENCTSEVHYAEICVSKSIAPTIPSRDETPYAKIVGILKPKERKVYT